MLSEQRIFIYNTRLRWSNIRYNGSDL